jgi:hypothetical protein
MLMGVTSWELGVLRVPLIMVPDSFWDHTDAMDSMVFEVAELDGATMMWQRHTNSKMKGYLLVLNVSNCYEVA